MTIDYSLHATSKWCSSMARRWGGVGCNSVTTLHLWSVFVVVSHFCELDLHSPSRETICKKIDDGSGYVAMLTCCEAYHQIQWKYKKTYVFENQEHSLKDISCLNNCDFQQVLCYSCDGLKKNVSQDTLKPLHPISHSITITFVAVTNPPTWVLRIVSEPGQTRVVWNQY